MANIAVMDENLANKIAAGEVIEKTMNVVKELVENSIDAGSDEIKIILYDSGVKEITVIDNGAGMDKEDAMRAFLRHATSKLKNLEDLFYISSLGFRGEALPSIASVSHLEMKTSNGKEGTEVIIEGGEILEVNKSDLKQGTRITVTKLFYNTPVRLKYLKNLYTELANITDYINRMALSFPNIKFMLSNNDKVILNTDGKGNLLKVISNIYGVDVAKKMIEVSDSNDDYEIKGYIGYPEIARTTKNNIITLVNGRTIKNSELNRCILDCYHTYIPMSKSPIIVINIETDPILIDVNVHPTKQDIKFSKMDSLKELLSKVITEKLETYNLIPEVKEVYDTIKEKEEEPITYKEPVIEEISLDLEVKEEKEDYDKKQVKKESIKEEIKEEVEPVKEPRIKKMYPVGVIDATYIIAENEDGMFIIDQHACCERINFEKYLDKLTNHDRTSIDLLTPITLDLSNRDYIILKENLPKLEDMGFVLEEFGGNTYVVRSHPAWLPDKDMGDSIKKIIDIIIENESLDYSRFIWKVAATLACKHSIRAHDIITKTDMENLLEMIRYCENPFTCPHGRPTIITYSLYELEKMFKRVMN
jgi:DNA mismatch repair protein MutL